MESGEPVMPKGSAGHRWDKEQGNWNMKLEDGESHEPYDPLLTLLDHKDEVAQVVFTEFGLNTHRLRGVPVKYIETEDGRIPTTTVYDLLMAQYGVDRGLGGRLSS